MSEETPHRRWNPLKEEWVLVSPHRGARPWRGAIEKVPPEKLPLYDASCQLCPRNKRGSGVKNPDYKGVFTFDNDFPALLESKQRGEALLELDGIVRTEPVTGACRVVCFSERHDLTLAHMDASSVAAVLNKWSEQYIELGARKDINHVMIFENKGEIMGCSNPHPHCQIWSSSSIPNIPLAGASAQRKYFAAHGRALLGDYLEWELKKKDRLIFDNGTWVAVVPYWAFWPYEAMLLPKKEASCIKDLSSEALNGWAEALRELLVRYDNLFECSFPYSMGLYQPPTDGGDWPGFTLHQIFFPPLLRSATVKKFMVGFELSAEPQRDITPEQAAQKLRSMSKRRFDSR